MLYRKALLDWLLPIGRCCLLNAAIPEFLLVDKRLYTFKLTIRVAVILR